MSLPGDRQAAAAAAIQKTFRTWSNNRRLEDGGGLSGSHAHLSPPPSAVLEDANPREVVLAAQRLQREAGAATSAQRVQRWRKYREAVHSSLQHQPDECCAVAAQRIQYHWRRYRRAVAEACGGNDPAATADDAAADSAQWSRASSQGSVHLSTADFDTICDWLDDLEEDGHHDEADDAASVAEQEHVVELLEDLISNMAVSSLPPHGDRQSPPPQDLAGQQGDLHALRDAAAVVIQRFVRRSIARRDQRHLDVPEAAINALRVLQNRFRINRLRRIVRERDRVEMARRIQELWRRRQETRSHFVALRRGREEAAARGIQNAYLRYKRRQGFTQTHQQQQHEAVSEHAGAPSLGAAAGRPLRADTTCLPQCIVCVEHEVDIALLPCGHAQLCHICSAQLRRCPTCRKVVALQVKIFL